MKSELHALLLSLFTDRTRLYRLEGEALPGLLVETWTLREALDRPWVMQLDALSLDAHLDLDAALGTTAVLHTRLADGTEFARSGIVMAAQALASDGGLARYRLRIEPWLGQLAHSRTSHVWQDRQVSDMLSDLFAGYRGAQWKLADDLSAHLAASPQGGLRSYVVQYRETDLDFLHRLLAREGISYRIEHEAEGQTVVFFADSVQAASCPEDRASASAAGGRGIRYHRAAAIEEQDSIQVIGGLRRLLPARVTALAWDEQQQRVLASEVPTAAAFGGANAPHIEHYSAEQDSSHAAPGDAAERLGLERSALHRQQALEARHKTWIGRGTVRSFSAGQHFRLTGSDLELPDGLKDETGEQGEQGDSSTTSARAVRGEDRQRYLLTGVEHLGINNLPKDASAAIVERLGAAAPGSIELDPAEFDPEHSAESSAESTTDPGIDPAVHRQAAAGGYANRFSAIRAAIGWRPAACIDPITPPSPGVLTATVVGADGSSAGGPHPLHIDAQGRVRIRFDFQHLAAASGGAASAAGSTWVRVLQRWAGSGHGQQFLPRIGQQVLVDFIDGRIERPLIIGSLYDGQGEAGQPATPAGASVEADRSAFSHSTDAAAAAQGNRSGGHSPAWHGAGAAALDTGGQRNAAAFSGTKSAEFHGAGSNQLVFDDSDRQLRIQLASSQAATQLNLGHLIHAQDNHRGSLRGLGFELRSDGHGAVRGGRGILLSAHGAGAEAAAADHSSGVALFGQMATQIERLDGVAGSHQGIGLAVGRKSGTAGGAKAAAARGWHQAVRTVVAHSDLEAATSDAAARRQQPGAEHVAAAGAAAILLAASAGVASVAGADIWSAAGAIHAASGADIQIGSAAVVRLASGQAIGLTAGVQGKGEGGGGGNSVGTGITVIAGGGDLSVKAQSDAMRLAAKDDLSIGSAGAQVDWAAAKKITLATAGGANVTIEGGNITVLCPGTITIRAGKRSFEGAAKVQYGLPLLPSAACVECMLKAARSGSPFSALQ
jgi:type VI secretion system secreted protein VgrG